MHKPVAAPCSTPSGVSVVAVVLRIGMLLRRLSVAASLVRWATSVGSARMHTCNINPALRMPLQQAGVQTHAHGLERYVPYMCRICARERLCEWRMCVGHLCGMCECSECMHVRMQAWHMDMRACVLVLVNVHVRVRACTWHVHVFVHTCMRACVHACMRPCVGV